MIDKGPISQNDARFVSFFMRHLVPILLTFDNGTNSHKVVITTFVLSVSSQWFLVTAGHCIEEIEELVARRGYRITGCCLIDSLGLDAKYPEPIPFNYQGAHPIHLNDKADFDYGFMALSPYYQQLLEKNGIQALNENVWKLQPNNVDFYLLLGIPGELVQVTSDHVKIAPTLYKVEPISERPSGFTQTEFPLFYGRIQLGDIETSIRGISGGPIFAFCSDTQGQLRYWLIALQSRWLPDSHYIAACPTKLLGGFLEAIIIRELPIVP